QELRVRLRRTVRSARAARARQRRGRALLRRVAARRAGLRNPRRDAPAGHPAGQRRAAGALSLAPAAAAAGGRDGYGLRPAERLSTATSPRPRPSAHAVRMARVGARGNAAAAVVAVGDGENLGRGMLLVHGLGVGGAEAMGAHLARHLRRSGDAVEVGCLGELGMLGEELRDEGIEVVVHARRSGFDPTLPWRLARRLRRQSIEVMHVHQRTAFFYGVLAGLLHPARIVYTEHSPWFGPPPRARQLLFNRALAWRAARITAVSRDARGALTAIEGFTARRIDVTPNAVDAERFAPGVAVGRAGARRELGLPPQAPIVGSVGRFDPVKNQRVLVQLLALLRRRFPDLLL